MPTKHTSHWLIDAALFTGLIAAFFLDLTGLELHQWIGVGIAVIATYHLLAHWQWVTAVTNRFFGKTSNKSRGYYLINLSILAGFFIITLTGLVISSWLDLTLSNMESWLTIHILASIGTLILVTLKIVLHWRWIAVVTRKVFSPSPAPAARPAPVAPAPSRSGQLSRAEFLKVIGFASAASLLALTQAVNSLAMTDAAAANTELASQTGSSSTSSATIRTSSASASTSSLASANQSCSVRCDKRCSYPGHCHRYTDSNGNGRCDFGECA
jgi:hypothetical protein